MLSYLIQRLGLTLITLIILSYTIFAIVQIPPGDAVQREVRTREAQGDFVTQDEIDSLRAQYGLDRPLMVRYWEWITNFIKGDMGRSIGGRTVNDLIQERIGQTVSLALAGLCGPPGQQ